MTLESFASLIAAAPAPVILTEGRRVIPDDAALMARRVSSMLARRFPALRFRSGNATGTDEAFAVGVIDVAPERLQIIAPYASHRARGRHPLVRYESPESLDPVELEKVQALTTAATPANKSLIRCYGRGGRPAAQAACLIRDTLKTHEAHGICVREHPPNPLQGAFKLQFAIQNKVRAAILRLSPRSGLSVQAIRDEMVPHTKEKTHACHMTTRITPAPEK